MGAFVAPILLVLLILIIIFFIIGTLLFLTGTIILIYKRNRKNRTQTLYNGTNDQNIKPAKKAVNVMAVIFIIVGLIFCIPGDFIIFKLVEQQIVQTNYKKTVICHIERNNYDEAIKLLEEGADPDSESSLYEQTPIFKLSHYSDKQNLEMAELLLKYGADPNWINPYGMTPLLIAVGSDNTEMVRLLIKYNVDVNYNKDGRSALSDARTRSNFDIVQLLLDSGAVE